MLPQFFLIMIYLYWILFLLLLWKFGVIRVLVEKTEPTPFEDWGDDPPKLINFKFFKK